MIPALIGAAGAIGGSLIGAGFGSLEGNKNRQHQWDMQQQQIKALKESQIRQAELNEIAAGKADKRARALYNDFESLAAKKAQLEQAGLSIGMLYGQGNMTSGHVGQGSQAAGTGIGQPSGASGNPYNSSSYISAGANAGLALAQSRLMESEANKNNAEADRLKGEGPRGEAEVNNINAVIQNTLADTKNKQAETELKKAQTHFANAEAALTELRTETEAKTQAAIVRNMALQNERAWEEIQLARWQNHITSETATSYIEAAKLQNQKTIQEIAQIRTNIKLTDAQCQKIAEEIAKIQYEAIEAKWRGLNEQDAYERFTKTMLQQEEFKNADIDQSQWETVVKGIFSLAGFGILKSGKGAPTGKTTMYGPNYKEEYYRYGE